MWNYRRVWVVWDFGVPYANVQGPTYIVDLPSVRIFAEKQNPVFTRSAPAHATSANLEDNGRKAIGQLQCGASLHLLQSRQQDLRRSSCPSESPEKWWKKHGCPLVNIQKAIENGHRNSWFAHSKWWFSIAILVYQRVTQVFPGFSTRTSGIPARRLDASRFHLPFLVLDSRQQRRHHAVLKCHAGSRMINIWWCAKILPDDFEISESSSFQQRDENKWHVWNHHPSVYHLCHHWTIEFPSAVKLMTQIARNWCTTAVKVGIPGYLTVPALKPQECTNCQGGRRQEAAHAAAPANSSKVILVLAFECSTAQQVQQVARTSKTGLEQTSKKTHMGFGDSFVRPSKWHDAEYAEHVSEEWDRTAPPVVHLWTALDRFCPPFPGQHCTVGRCFFNSEGLQSGVTIRMQHHHTLLLSAASWHAKHSAEFQKEKLCIWSCEKSSRSSMSRRNETGQSHL